ncbi:TPA: efflux RND transporter periplasmic adaptor subunit [Stenotrophomonas maltophilia]|uniref:efflux RND transporter periplasmic adaptor subunit n=1 Tax=Stenotrophomonas sp. Sm0041 TaxID=3002751 RepID=UPI0018D3DFE9|nr:efflux RND transporter periplasmic adaptor subunit [Stenotrophomonas sp. Sm0041]MBH1408297.1 efflux RND transporter periplasmic adaptor subunit [Stenotrophomonas maltophilia]MBH1481744.1 efflux RND transporter periplasmic adaptor subunit [Stenotrophomonas maltophilia]MDQ7292536.1 efflux RND transporter periplasmic adaptor subunit [Stenotrophomonas sp. Sm0041]HDS1300714.1 efflux RND transporter periplasmic adaptor subunit [Stenotrophomonas maltophilia]HDS1303112.1 efflux RND transporter peri
MSATNKIRFISCLALASLLAACGGSKETSSEEPSAPTFEIVTVHAGEQSEQQEWPGRISPVRIAEIRSRVAGIVLSREFEEGAEVKAGQVLFRIDPSAFRAELSRAEGELAKAKAELNEARTQERRLGPLATIKAISQQDYEVALTRLRTAEAGLQSNKAAVESAKIQLGHATVRSPIDGRIGRALVTEGALVGQDSSTAMAIVQQLDPIYADFSQPAGDMLRMRAAATGSAGAGDPTVTIEIPETGAVRSGTLLFTDIAVDPETERIAMRGQFPNSDGMLLPGMFVRVRINTGKASPVVLVPQRAIQRDAAGKAYVMLVGDDNAIHVRKVETSRMQDGNWQVIRGLREGERVVASGVEKVKEGMKVPSAKTRTQTAPSPTQT